MTYPISKLSYINYTGKLVKILRYAQSYDDSSGMMIDNKLILQMLFASGVNLYSMNSFQLINLLKQNIIGFENASYSNCDCDVIKCVVLQLIK